MYKWKECLETPFYHVSLLVVLTVKYKPTYKYVVIETYFEWLFP